MDFSSTPPCIPHTVAVMDMVIAFHTKDPDRMEDELNIFLFPDLYLVEGLEALMVA